MVTVSNMVTRQKPAEATRPRGGGRLVAGGLLAAGALVLAGAAADFSLGQAAGRDTAGVLAALRPDEPARLIELALQDLARNPARPIASREIAAARAHLAVRPLDPQALVLLGLAADARAPGGTAASPFMQLANRISRREPVSQIWMIEAASASGDVPQALRHYHTVLSTNPELFDLLAPVLVKAIDFPEVQKALRPYVRDDVAWMTNFLPYAAANGRLDSTLAMIGPHHAVLRRKAYDPITPEFTRRLARAGRGDEALAFARRVHGDFQPAAFRSFAPSPASADARLGVLAWTPAQEGGVQSEIGESGDVRVTVDPGASGIALSREFLSDLSARDRLSHRLVFDPGQRPDAIEWRGSCAEDGRPARSWSARVPIRPGASSQALPAGLLASCRLVRFELHVFGKDGQLPATFTLSDIALD